MDIKTNRKVDPESPVMLICVFCENFFYGKRGQVSIDPFFYPKVNKDCPICESPLQILGAHPGAWSGSFVVGIEPTEPMDA
jgi:hypothetical protein